MKKLLTITLAILFASLTIGCGTAHASKETYNVAYISIAFLTTEDKDSSYIQKLNKTDSAFFRQSDDSYYCHITDWEYGKNDTIILYLTDGRTLQTSTNNVVLMYEPDIK